MLWRWLTKRDVAVAAGMAILSLVAAAASVAPGVPAWRQRSG